LEEISAHQLANMPARRAEFPGDKHLCFVIHFAIGFFNRPLISAQHLIVTTFQAAGSEQLLRLDAISP
jgi:hypothetical protein